MINNSFSLGSSHKYTASEVATPENVNTNNTHVKALIVSNAITPVLSQIPPTKIVRVRGDIRIKPPENTPPKKLLNLPKEIQKIKNL